MELTNEEQLDYFAEMIEPAAEILSDGEIAKQYRSGKRVQAVALAIRSHKQAVIRLLAALNCKDAAEYRVPNPIALAAQMLTLANTEEVQILFSSQTPGSSAASSGSATENTEDGAK